MKKKASKDKPRARKPLLEQPRQAAVYIAGDSPMVEEYASLCSSHGYEVFCAIPEGSGPARTKGSNSVRTTAKIPQHVSFALELTNLDLEKKRRNLQVLDRTLPQTTAIASSSVTVSATEQLSWVHHKTRLIGFCSMPTISHAPIVEVAPTAVTPSEAIQVVRTFFRSLGKEIEFVQDRVGMVFPRLMCQIINEALFALQEEVTSPEDLDLAMKLGAHYPYGPIEWADRIGLNHVVAVLAALHRDLGEERYRISPLLRQMATGGPWWKRSSTILS